MLLIALIFPWSGSVRADTAASPDWHFEFSDGVPDKLVWQAEAGVSYDLWHSEGLENWTYVDGFPQTGSGGPMEYAFESVARGFFRIISEAAAPDGFVTIPGGWFQMGDQSDPEVGYPNELPVHSVNVSRFHMGRHEVTKALWEEVRTWGASHGYTDLSAGGGKAADHPVQDISWYAMVKWCNACSEKEDLTPCYRVSGAVYRIGNSDEVECNWSADGYRLPTEAEWEKAARGGLAGKNFPWGDTISHSQANFWNSGGESYATGTTGPHPDWDEGGYPYTSPVGSFAPNGYGLYDMSGNVREWCWDWYGSYSSGSQTAPRGPASGTARVLRGGSWGVLATYCRVAGRLNGIAPADTYYGFGFRPARSSVP